MTAAAMAVDAGNVFRQSWHELSANQCQCGSFIPSRLPLSAVVACPRHSLVTRDDWPSGRSVNTTRLSNVSLFRSIAHLAVTEAAGRCTQFTRHSTGHHSNARSHTRPLWPYTHWS